MATTRVRNRPAQREEEPVKLLLWRVLGWGIPVAVAWRSVWRFSLRRLPSTSRRRFAGLWLGWGSFLSPALWLSLAAAATLPPLRSPSTVSRAQSTGVEASGGHLRSSARCSSSMPP